MDTDELTNEAIDNFNKLVADGESYVSLTQKEIEREGGAGHITYTFEVKKIIKITIR